MFALVDLLLFMLPASEPITLYFLLVLSCTPTELGYLFLLTVLQVLLLSRSRWRMTTTDQSRPIQQQSPRTGKATQPIHCPHQLRHLRCRSRNVYHCTTVLGVSDYPLLKPLFNHQFWVPASWNAFFRRVGC